MRTCFHSNRARELATNLRCRLGILPSIEPLTKRSGTPTPSWSTSRTSASATTSTTSSSLVARSSSGRSAAFGRGHVVLSVSSAWSRGRQTASENRGGTRDDVVIFGVFCKVGGRPGQMWSIEGTDARRTRTTRGEGSRKRVDEGFYSAFDRHGMGNHHFISYS